ncbi:sulfonate transport system permease protein [Rhizobium sp. RU35A]|uniref:ABC transporter permease n=1 Tax=Rhizobium sp. RU35A TaxID=1907414 RepID=UPI0009541667|nr:ABC transporter permease [Rhizobium sp. RU35A]SIR35331.1 sulfonate transport system permease protein [Rhizobium sp. RU35A]
MSTFEVDLHLSLPDKASNGLSAAPRARRLVATAVVVALAPLLLLLFWWLSAARGWVSPQVLPQPAWVWQTFVDLVVSGDIIAAAAISFRRIAEGFLLGATSGFLFGLLIGTSRSADAYLGPTFRALAAIPSLGWLPILILILGIEETLKIVILAKACFVPMAISTADGARNIPAKLSDVADVLGIRRSTRFFRLTIPAMAPFLASGIRLSLSQAFVSLIVVEMLAGSDGLGYLMVWGRTLFQLDIVIVGMIVVGTVGFLLDLLLRRMEKAIVRGASAHG